MNRLQLEHVLRASASLSGCREMVVIGSQALLASHPDAPESLLRSMEVDLYPLEAPEKADLIDGSIGELSPFHDAFGYYAHGVGVETAILPSGWRDRWIRVESEGALGWRGVGDLPAQGLEAATAVPAMATEALAPWLPPSSQLTAPPRSRSRGSRDRK